MMVPVMLSVTAFGDTCMAADPAQTWVEKTLKHDAPLISCRFDPTGTFVFAGGQDNLVVRWNIETDAKVTFAAHDSWVRSFAFSKSGDTVITAGYDGRLIWWPATAEQPQPVRTLQAHNGWVRALAVSPDGQLLASCGDDLKVKLWQISDGALVRELTGKHERHVYNVAFHPDGQQLASGDLVGKFVQWNLQTGEAVREFKIESISKYDAGFQADYGGPYSMTFTADGSRLLASGITNVTNAFAAVGNPIISSIDWSAGKEAAAHLLKENPNGKVWGVAWHPDGFVMGAVGGNAGGRLAFWKPDQKDEFHQLNLGNSVRDLSLHPDGVRVATPHHDGQCRISRMAPKPA